jgi:hypothetical protein
MRRVNGIAILMDDHHHWLCTLEFGCELMVFGFLFIAGVYLDDSE